MTYYNLNTATQIEPVRLIIKKSEFIAYAYAVTSREQVLSHVEQLRSQYPDARHHCWAYIIGDPNNTTSAGYDDDGEPKGTAGKPILNVLQHKNIGDTLIVVVRYFGGIKLGAGGLTRAYSGSAQAMIDTLPLVAHIERSEVCIATDYAHESQIRYLLAEVEGQISDVQYGENVLVYATIEQHKVTELESSLGVSGRLVDLDN